MDHNILNLNQRKSEYFLTRSANKCNYYCFVLSFAATMLVLVPIHDIINQLFFFFLLFLNVRQKIFFASKIFL